MQYAKLYFQENCFRMKRIPITETPLTNRVREPYCNLRTAFFPQFIARVQSTSVMNWSGKNKVPVRNSTDRENEVSKMFIISLGNWIKLESRPRSQAVRILGCGTLNQPITAHLVPERNNKELYTAQTTYQRTSRPITRERRRTSDRFLSKTKKITRIRLTHSNVI